MALVQPTSVATSIVSPQQIDEPERQAMIRLMHTYYEDVCEEAFLRDLDSKHWVIRLVCQETGILVGFSTQRLLHDTVADQRVRVLFSGDTIVDRKFWNSPKLAQAWGRFALQRLDESAMAPLYWLLLSKGFRTYRFLSLFFHQYIPGPNQAAPELSAIRDLFSEKLYGNAYDRQTGVVSGTEIGNYRLRQSVAKLTAQRSDDPDIRYFLTSNRGHESGDELCCVAPITRENFTNAAIRVIGNLQ